MPSRHIAEYILSLPERVLRSATALAGGLLREIGDVAVPDFVRGTRLYTALVDSTLRFLVEQVGEVEGAYPSETKLAENFLLRRTAGNGLELIGILTFRASPVWVMAALADASSAGKQLLAEISDALRKEGLIAPDSSVESADQLLTALERSSARISETFNTPPLDWNGMRQELKAIHADLASIPTPQLPSPDYLSQRWTELTSEADRQGRTVWELSSLMALGAVTRTPEAVWWLGKSASVAAVRTGEMVAGSLFEHYRRELTEIHNMGYLRYCARELRPYWHAAAKQFSPGKISLTQRLLGRKALAIATLLCAGLAPAQQATQRAKPRATAPAAQPGISPEALEAHVRFLASDLLEGRDTPSRGLDIAAEYIASSFEQSGLQPATPEGYFQVTKQLLTIKAGDRTISIAPEHVAGTLPMLRCTVWKVTEVESIRRDRISNRCVLTTPERVEAIEASEFSPLALIVVSPSAIPDQTTLTSPEFAALVESLPEGNTRALITHVPAGQRNVIGVIPGSDPALREQTVLLTAHYDHVGVKDQTGDRIFNGANDNASSVSALLEVAKLIQASKQRPKRRIAVIAFFGEEKGLVGSFYYVQNPVFPLETTAAQLNAEQLGRTDDSEGIRVAAASMPGYGFTEIGAVLTKSGNGVGVQVTPGKDDYFASSDNYPFAAAGVPANTIAVAYGFPDYHRPGDESQKLDYKNMAAIARMIAVGVVDLANLPQAPRWLTTNPAAKSFWSKATPLSKPLEVSAPESGSSPATPPRTPQQP